MPKRKISSDAAIADILNFVENDESDFEDFDDDLNERFDDEQLKEAAESDSSDDDNELPDIASSHGFGKR